MKFNVVSNIILRVLSSPQLLINYCMQIGRWLVGVIIKYVLLKGLVGWRFTKSNAWSDLSKWEKANADLLKKNEKYVSCTDKIPARARFGIEIY